MNFNRQHQGDTITLSDGQGNTVVITPTSITSNPREFQKVWEAALDRDTTAVKILAEAVRRNPIIEKDDENSIHFRRPYGVDRYVLAVSGELYGLSITPHGRTRATVGYTPDSSELLMYINTVQNSTRPAYIKDAVLQIIQDYINEQD